MINLGTKSIDEALSQSLDFDMVPLQGRDEDQSGKSKGGRRFSTPAQRVLANVNPVDDPGAHRRCDLALSIHVGTVCRFLHNRTRLVNTHSHLDLCYPGSFTHSNGESSR